ncbi:unnamed protein product, partial [Ectocarpus sp. 8 AP-2014]
MAQRAGVCDADEPALRTYSESTLRSIHKDDLIAFGENFCGIKFPEGAKQDAIVQLVRAHIARKGRGTEHVGHLVAQ